MHIIHAHMQHSLTFDEAEDTRSLQGTEYFNEVVRTVVLVPKIFICKLNIVNKLRSEPRSAYFLITMIPYFPDCAYDRTVHSIELYVHNFS